MSLRFTARDSFFEWARLHGDGAFTRNSAELSGCHAVISSRSGYIRVARHETYPEHPLTTAYTIEMTSGDAFAPAREQAATGGRYSKGAGPKVDIESVPRSSPFSAKCLE